MKLPKQHFLKYVLIGFCMTTYIMPFAHAQTLQIYGGRNHDTYLGCLNCNKFDAASIWNAYGSHGSKFQPHSIWNRFGEFGNAYSQYSPFNTYASNPPVIVDRQGNFYGYFTINTYHHKRADFDLVKVIYRFWKLIPDDVSKWYDEIF